MPNPFDQFDTAQAQANPFDQFDPSDEGKPSAKGSSFMDAASKVLSKDGLKKVLEDTIENVSAIPDLAGSLLGGAAAPLIAPVPAALKTINDVSQGKGAHFLQNYEDMSNSSLINHEPVTELGGEASRKVGDALNSFLPAMLGHMGDMHVPDMPEKPLKDQTVVDKVKAAQDKLDAAKKGPANPFDQFDGAGQKELFGIDEQPRGANPYEAQAGMWVKDENGIPIRADLSMEAQNLESPLQRNLWGDELQARENPVGQSAQLPMDRDIMGFPKMTEDPRTMMENDLGMTQALDTMPDLPWRSERDTAIDSLKGELEASGPLKTAKMDADIAAGGDVPTTPRNPYRGFGKSQAGAIDADILVPKFLRDMVDKWRASGGRTGLPDILRIVQDGDGHEKLTPMQRTLLKTEFPDIANAYDERIKRHDTAGNHESAQRYREQRDRSLIAEAIGRKLDWTKTYDHDAQEYVPKKAVMPGDRAVQARHETQTTLGKLGRGPGKNQAGAINPEIFRDGFQKLKQLADGVWLRAHSDGQMLTVDVHKDGHVVGSTTFNPKYSDQKLPNGTYDRDLVASWTGVDEGQRGKGYATEAYKFAHELGNDIKPSNTQTEMGKAMWDGFSRKGEVFDKSTPINKGPMRGERGAVLFGRDPAKQQLEKVLGKQDLLSEKPNVDAALEASRGLKDSNSSNNLGSGATLEAMKRRSPAVQALARISQYAQKLGDKNIRDNVVPVEKAFRSLARGELREVAGVLKEEMLRGKRFDPEAIAEMSVKQQVAYAHMRTMLDDTLRVQNEQRALRNQKSITHMEAYASSRWKGDFRRPLYRTAIDAEGKSSKKLAWYLAADSKFGLERQTKALQKQFPDLSFNPKEDHTVRSYKRQTDLQTAYSTIIDILGRDDPAVSKIKDYLETQTTNEAASFLGQQKHFETKAGIRGFVGDRPGHSGLSEAVEFLQQQIQYAKNAYNWSAIQGVAPELKKLISDPTLRDEQPNNAAYMRDYVKNLLGHSEHTAISAISDAVRTGMGFSPALVSRGISNMKSFFIVQKLAGLGQTVSNLIQPANIVPHLLASEYGAKRINILTALPVGIAAGMAMATGHFATFLMDIKGAKPDGLNFYQRAFRYAEDNGITARSIVDESPISTTFSVPGQIGKGLGRLISTPEAFARSISFMTAVQFLKDSGKFTKDMDLFSKAEDLVNASMVDYRGTERPLGFAKLGGLGDALNTLQTYPMNWYNQFNLFAREGIKGNPAPFVAFLGIQYALAGAMGIPGFNDVDKLYQMLKDHVVAKLAPSKYAEMQQSEFWSSPKLWMAHHLGSASVYGALSDATGIALTSRLNTPGAADMIQAPGGPAIDLAKQAVNAGTAIVSPTRDNIAQSAMSSAPVGVQGLVENLPQFKGSTYDDRTLQDGTQQRLAMRPADIGAHQAVYARDDADTKARLFGFRTQKEAESREVGYLMGQATKTSQEVSKSIPGDFYTAIKNGQMDKARDLNTAYIKLTGQGISNSQFEQQIRENYMTTVERASTAAKSISALQNVARMRAMLDQIQKEQGK